MTTPATAAQIYRWDDSNAPVVSGTRGSLVALLKACLVDGYNLSDSETANQRPAPGGWTVAFESVDGQAAAFRIPTDMGTGKYLKVDEQSSANAYNPSLQGFEAMTDIDTGLNGFPAAAIVGEDVYNGTARKGLFISDSAGTTARPWIVIANEVFIWVMIWTDAAVSATPLISNYYSSFVFGDFVPLKTDDSHNALLSVSSAVATDNISYQGKYSAGAFGSTGYFGYDFAMETKLAYIAFPRTAGGVSPSYDLPCLLGNGPSSPIQAGTGYGGTMQIHGDQGIPYNSGDPMIMTKPFVPDGDKSIRGYIPGLRNPYAFRPFAICEEVADPDTGERFVALGGRGYYDYLYCLVSLDNFWV